MKKLIAILMVLAIVTGFVFASDPLGTTSNGSAAIEINATINPAYPLFQLRATGFGTNNEASSSEDFTNPVTDNVENNGANNPASITITADDMLTKSAVVNFDIYQRNDARAMAKYDLAVTATDLLLVQKADGTAVTSGQTAAQKFTVSPTTITVTPATGAAVANVTLSGATAGKLTAQYNGGPVAETTLGTFACTWAANASAEAGQYKATITLTVTATN